MTGSVVAICVDGVSHMRTLLPVLEGLRARGLTVQVMTRQELQPEVERIDARFVDLFEGHPVEAVDDASLPIASRHVTYAGVHGERLAAEVAELAPSLIVYETFSVIGPVIARRLGLPYVNVTPNHAAVPERMVAALRQDPRVSTSPECWAAVERLREVHGMEDANPFSYMESLSPHLNLYPEPAEFLNEADREALAPLAFFGSLAPDLFEEGDVNGSGGSVFPTHGERRRILVSFGTIIWRYYEAEALAALEVLARTCADIGNVDVTISLGGRKIGAAALDSLRQSNAQVLDYVDQWGLLPKADVFVTHHGINSTHEAIFHRVPMLSYPFFGDQPPLAERCRELGLAVPLATEPRGEVTAEGLRAALTRLDDDRDGFSSRLAEARSWELRTIAGRERAIDRMLELAGDPGANRS